MKFTKRFMAIAIALMVMLPAMAQFKIGPRLGVDVNSLHFNKDVFQEDNRAGFTGGLQAEFMIPGLGFGFDASVMYVRRSATFTDDQRTEVNADYIEIPVNLKYKLGLPLLGNILKPYVFTGPSFSFLTSRRFFSDFVNKNSDTAWNFGFGIELINHLQLSASYAVGMSKALDVFHLSNENANINGKNRYWTVTAAWLF
ncbi:MAG: PorT family protein [Muribaculaceae bacterium]